MSAVTGSPKISIIIPTYNRAVLIMEAIESVCKQTYSNWELLIIDDCSQDNTEELIRSKDDERIFYYKTDKRIGIEETRNVGLQKASGELIAFMDSDDLWAVTKLEKQVVAMQQYPEAGFCLTGGYNFKKINEPVAWFYKQREGIKYENVFIDFFESKVAVTMPTLMVRKDCLRSAGVFRGDGTLDLFLDLAKNFKAVILYEPLFFRRLHAENYSMLNAEKGHLEGVEMAKKYESSLPPKVYHGFLFNTHINFGEKCLLHEQRKKAINQFFRAWMNKPLSIIPPRKIAKSIFSGMRK